jgi:hypothetical protein
MLKNSGSGTVTKNRGILFKQGFPMQITTPKGNDSEEDILPGESISQCGSNTSDTENKTGEIKNLYHPDLEGNPSVDFKKGNSLRIVYSDPWKAFAAQEICRRNKLKEPAVKVWGGDGYRIQDPLPVSMFGDRWTGGKNRVRFADLKEHEIQMYVILYKTHFGNFLRESTAEKSKCKHRLFCHSLRNKISEFLKGHTHPSWNQEKISITFGEGKYIPRNRKTRSQRLIEVLKTVDGMFLSRYLSTPTEAWTWRKFDMYTLWNLSFLLDDEFYDGKLAIEAGTIMTSYAQLKKSRQEFKEASHKGNADLKALAERRNLLPAWLRNILPIWKDCSRYTGHQYTMRIGILCQTRGCGTPPPCVILASKEKFLLGCQVKPDRLTDVESNLIKLTISSAIAQIPDSAFTGLSTKSRITVTSSACWEDTRREGGTTEAIRELVASGAAGGVAEIRDLDTGKLLGREGLSTLSAGEYIFWKCLEKVLRMTDQERRRAFLSVVKEPGKARSITKSSAYTKVILDLVSKICSEPLKKGVPSSSSGMSKAHHGWNLFQEYMRSQEEEVGMFDLAERTSTKIASGLERTDVYQDVYTLSTDYAEATDHMNHEVARIIGTNWMRKCGIPVVLRKLVSTICYQEREIYFRTDGFVKQIGRESDIKDIRFVILRQGILMGDPLTKPVLHLINICVRELANNAKDARFFQQGFLDANRIQSFLLRGT